MAQENGIVLNLHNLFLGVFVPDWILRIPNERVGAQAKLVYGRLLRYAGRDGRCTPQLAAIAEHLGCSVRSVSRALEELRTEGLISTCRHPNRLSFWFHWHGEITKKDIKNMERLQERLAEAGYTFSVLDLFQNRDRCDASVAVPEKKTAAGDKCQGGRTEMPSWQLLPFKERKRRESIKGVHTEPAPKAFTTSSEAAGPKPKLEAVESAPDVGEQTADVKKPVDRLAAARAREASLRAQVSKPNGQTSKRPERSDVKEKNFPPSEKSHTESSHNPYRSKAAAARREREPFYRSPMELRGVWEEEVHKILPELTVAPWRGRDGKMMKDLMAVYRGDEVERLFQYVLGNWTALRRRYFRGKGGPIPSVPTLIRFQDSWMAESVVWEKSLKVVEEVDTWIKTNRRNPRGEMLNQYEAAKRELDSLDLGS